MIKTVALALAISFLLGITSSYADPLPNGLPPVNSPLVGCIEGRSLRIVNGVPACSNGSAPTLSGCGTGATLSANATDFVGKITTGTGLISACTLTLTKLYSNPGMGCIVQSNSAASLALTPTVTNTTVTTIQIPLSVSVSGSTITYACFPI